MDPLEQAKKLREEYERALDAAESRRAAYHEAVLELHRSGKPLREIAKELGLSHQRVHQIVSGEPPRRRNLGRVAGGVGGLLILVAAAITAAFWIQSYQPLGFAPAEVLTANSINTVGEGDHGAWIGYQKGIGGGPNRPFFGSTIQNTGRFTVRVDGLGRYWPAIPIIRGWSARLLMAQGRFVQEPVRIGNQYVRDRSGHIVRHRVWKRGPLQPFHPVDLAPGEILMVAIQGVWHDCQLRVPGGATIPPRSLSLRYSFLWKTATAQIPLPSGLRIAPPNHHPNQDCHKSARTGNTKSHGKHSA